MTLTSRLKNLEFKKPRVADSNAKHRLMQHLQTIADRQPPATPAEQQASQDWLVTEWPHHLRRILSNATE